MITRSSYGIGLFALLFLTGCMTTEIDDRPRASSYGVDDPLMAALVVRDESGGFDIRSVSLKGVDTLDEYHWGEVPQYVDQSYEIKPGRYNIYLGYSELSGMFECSGSATGEFNAEAGLAVGFAMANGSVGGCSMMYDPPKAGEITGQLKRPESPKVTKSINWGGTLCIVIPSFMVLLVGGAVAFLLLRNRKSVQS
jgi:hypothetical protein